MTTKLERGTDEEANLKGWYGPVFNSYV